MKRLVRRIVLAVAAVLLLFYLGDYAFLRARLPGAMETVTVQPFYAVPQKDGKTEFMMLDPEDDPCVDSILPHMGDPPCWYLKKHTQKRIDM
jgi:hypothetical protein